MHIEEIEVKNFRGIREVHLENLKSTVVIVGANGSGKSCIFDAIRLLKSAYGGYQQNEWHHWMNEFQINFSGNIDAFQAFFQDPSERLSIKCRFRLHPRERDYLVKHGENLVRASVWRLIAPEMNGWTAYNAAPLAAQYRGREEEVSRQTKEQFEAMLLELSQESVVGHLWAENGGEIHFAPSKALEIIFSSFEPGELGLIDYHGPQRMYTREQVSNVNLDLNVNAQNSRNHALYNYNNKYASVKSEMASSYVKEILAREAGVSKDEFNPISKTLEELFKTFFPDKRFLGIRATPEGGVEFPVETSSGAVHDLNELSAGEKEVLFGYLRIRNSAPAYSLILIDEPELHLNPRLIQGLPAFYHEHLGLALENQLWLVTHSDTLLREVIGRPEYSVFHMTAASLEKTAPQISALTLREETERAIISLVGDIAAYRPGSKIVIIEGGGDSEFDASLIGRLYPEFVKRTNLISGGNKLRVRELHDVLDAAYSLGKTDVKVFSITDADGEFVADVTSPRFKWGVYHIENYLLEERFIRLVLDDLGYHELTSSEEGVLELLRASARECLIPLVQHALVGSANKMLTGAINLSFDPKRRDVGASLFESVQRSAKSFEKVSSETLSLDFLEREEVKVREKFSRDLTTGDWKYSFRGRDVLKHFCKIHIREGYETFRTLVISKMVEGRHQPVGMSQVIDQIASA